MKVKLLKHIMEEGRVKASVRKTRGTTVFVEGAIVEVSDATGKKWISYGLAEEIKEVIEVEGKSTPKPLKEKK